MPTRSPRGASAAVTDAKAPPPPVRDRARPRDATTLSRVERKREVRVRAILAAAAELFAERGYDAVSLDDVAQRLDVTKGSLYYYFTGKDELGTAAIESLGHDWMARLEALTRQHEGTPRARLRALLHEHIRIAVCEYPEALRIFLSPRDWPQPQARRIRALRKRHDAIFREAVEAGIAAGEFQVISLDVALQCMHAAMTHAPSWASALPDRARARAIDELSDTLLLLVGCAPAAAPVSSP